MNDRRQSSYALMMIVAIIGGVATTVSLAPPDTARAGREFSDIARSAGVDVGSVLSFGDPCVADLNGDGLLDLVIDRHNSTPWDVYHGDASGGYVRQIPDATAPSSATPVPGRRVDTHSCTSGDVDRDGDIDLIAAVGACNGTCLKRDDLWINDGATWSLRSDLLGPENYDRNREGVLADLNADGWLDYVAVAAGHYGVSKQRVYWNNGLVDGMWSGFTQQVLVAASGPGTCVDAHDIDGDGDLDIVMCGNRGLIVFNGPTYSTRQFYDIDDIVQVDFADLDESNAGSEILLTRQSALEIRTLDLTRTMASWPLLSGADSEVLDVDGDGADDIYLIQGLSAQEPGSLGSHFLLLREANRWVRAEVPQPAEGAGSHVAKIPGFAGGTADAALVLNGGENRLTRQWDRKGPRQLVVGHAFGGGSTTTSTLVHSTTTTTSTLVDDSTTTTTSTLVDDSTTTTTSQPATTLPPVPGSGVVGEWRLDEGSGIVALDSSGNGLDGVLLNGVSHTAGRSGTGTLHAGAVNQHVRVADAPVLGSMTDSFTLSAWVRPSDLAASKLQGIVTRQFGSFSSDQWFLKIISGSPTIGVNTVGGGEQKAINSKKKLVVGQWTHLAGTYDGVSLRLYLNGVQVASRSKSGAIVAASTPVVIGGNQNNAVANAAQELFRGVIDDVVIRNVALTPIEIEALATP